MNRVSKFRNIHLIDEEPSHLESSGLSVKFRFNWPSIDEDVMQSGFLITIDFLSAVSIPIAIPAGADALITLSATKEERLTDCRQNLAQTKLEFFEGYEPTESIVRTNNGLRLLTTFVGCDTPALSHVPTINSTIPICMPLVVYAVKTSRAIHQQVDGITVAENATKSAVSIFLKNSFSIIKVIFFCLEETGHDGR